MNSGNPLGMNASEKHIVIHLYTTNGGTKNNVDLIHPNGNLLMMLSSTPDVIRKNNLSRQSLQEGFGEASSRWMDIKAILDNYSRENPNSGVVVQGRVVENGNNEMMSNMGSSSGQGVDALGMLSNMMSPNGTTETQGQAEEQPQTTEGEQPQTTEGEQPQTTEGEQPVITEGEQPQTIEGDVQVVQGDVQVNESPENESLPETTQEQSQEQNKSSWFKKPNFGNMRSSLSNIKFPSLRRSAKIVPEDATTANTSQTGGSRKSKKHKTMKRRQKK